MQDEAEGECAGRQRQCQRDAKICNLTVADLRCKVKEIEIKQHFQIMKESLQERCLLTIVLRFQTVRLNIFK